MFTRSLISPTQADLYGRVQSERTDTFSTMVITNIIFFLKTTIFNFQGDDSQWVVYSEVSNDLAYIKSKNRWLIFLPELGWQYFNSDYDHSNFTDCKTVR